MNNGSLFIISAPSGAGKTSLVEAVLAREQQFPLERIITYTTKLPRSTESNGKDYHFIAHEEFEHKINQNFFLEWSTTYQHYYGTPAYIYDRLRNGISCFLIIDRLGARSIIEKIPQATLIWITTKDIETLRQRLQFRNTETAEQIDRRLSIAADEIKEEENNPFYHHYIFNDNFENAVENLQKIVDQALLKNTQKPLQIDNSKFFKVF